MTDNAKKSNPPVVVDLGKVKRKLIRQLKLGRGELVAEVEQVVDRVRRDLGPEAEGKEILPVVVLYRKKRKKRSWFDL